MDNLEFPDGVDAVLDLIAGKEFAGLTVRAGSFMPVDAMSTLPFALVIGQGGTPGFVDQVERLRIEVYATGNDARHVAQAIRTEIAGEGIDTPSGFLDAIKFDGVPTSTPYHDTTDIASLLLSVISRPL